MVFACPPEFLALAHRLADQARPIVAAYFRTADLAVESKTPHDPVTLADRAIEQSWRKTIHAEHPHDAIWGEEYGRTNEDAEWTWIFDPIDGTKMFTLGRATFGCMIGLHHKEHGFVLGVVDQPIVDLRWAAVVGQGATLNGKLLRTTHPDLAAARLAITNVVRLPPALRALHDTLQPRVGFITYGGDVMNFTGLADGSLHATFEAGQKIYDIAAAIPIIREAGGVITAIDGSAIALVADHTVLAACTPELHAHILAQYSKDIA